MTLEDSMIEKVAKSVGASVEAVQSRLATVLTEHGMEWKNAGKSDDDCEVLALRVAARQIANDARVLKRSGATLYEGMFVNAPRYKDWGAILYKKMTTTLLSLPEDGREALVSQGKVVLYDDNHDGTFTRTANPSLLQKQQFVEGSDTHDVDSLPKGTVELDTNTHYYIVWDKNNTTFPSGDPNFKYGAPRPTQERERTSLFFGRPQGDTGGWTPITVKASGKAAEDMVPTFVPGTYAFRLAKNGLTGYAKVGVSTFTESPDAAAVFDSPPVMADGDIFGGTMPDYLQDDFLAGLSQLPAFYDANNGTDGWWDRIVGLVAEVIHIDPRDNGGYSLVCSDLDITSTAPMTEVYVAASQEHLVDFAVGTKVLLIGQPWKTQDDEYRFSVNGWWAFDTITPAVVEATDEATDGDDDGWDA